jgi:hypothetical protein
MTKLEKYIFELFAPYLIKNQCPKKVSLGWRDAESRNCYYVHVYSKSELILAVRGLEANGVNGKFFDGNKSCSDACIPYKWLNLSDIRVTHFYGTSTFEYKSFIKYILNGFTRKDLALSYLRHIYANILQFFFNRTKLVMVQRHELLKTLVQNHFKSTHTGIDQLDLMTKLHSIRWITHPEGEAVEKELELYLDSLVETGKLSKINTEYVVKGKAIVTIENYEEAERRHRDNLRSQRRMIYLTILLAIFALVQAGVIKVPTLFDLSCFK